MHLTGGAFLESCLSFGLGSEDGRASPGDDWRRRHLQPAMGLEMRCRVFPRHSAKMKFIMHDKYKRSSLRRWGDYWWFLPSRFRPLLPRRPYTVAAPWASGKGFAHQKRSWSHHVIFDHALGWECHYHDLLVLAIAGTVDGHEFSNAYAKNPFSSSVYF